MATKTTKKSKKEEKEEKENSRKRAQRTQKKIYKFKHLFVVISQRAADRQPFREIIIIKQVSLFIKLIS